MTITAEESTQQIYDALIKVFKDAKVPKSNDVIPKVAAVMKLMLAFIDGDGDLQLHPRSNMPGKVLRLMAEVAQAMPGVLVDFTVATGNGHRSVTYTSNTVVALLNGTQWLISTQDDFRRPILYGVIAHFFKMSDLFDICPIRAINKRKGTLRSFRVLTVRTEQIIFRIALVPRCTNETSPSAFELHFA